jgi:hypothetical protein
MGIVNRLPSNFERVFFGEGTVRGLTPVEGAQHGCDSAGRLQLAASPSYKEGCFDAGKISQATNSTITISSARLNTATKTVTVKLAGTFATGYVYSADGSTAYSDPGTSWENAAWTAVGITPLAGKYGAVNIKGLVSDSSGWNNVAIKNTNPSLVFYTGSTDIVDQGTPLDIPVATTGKNIKLDVDEGEIPYKWRFYTKDPSPALPQDDVLGVLLYDGVPAAERVVTLEVTQYENSTVNATTTADATPVLTVIIDYSAVGFGS